jgi:hypothetical protein
MERHLNQQMAALAHSEIQAMTRACFLAKGLNMAEEFCDTPIPPVVLRTAAQAHSGCTLPSSLAFGGRSSGSDPGG